MNKAVRENISRGLFTACAVVLILSMAAIFVFVGSHAYQTFTNHHVSLFDFFFGTSWDPDSGEVGALNLIEGTFLVTILAVLISTPISLGVAVFVTEIAPPWIRQIMQPVLELFIGIPSIVYGLLALQILVPFAASIYNSLAGAYYSTGFGLIAAAIVLAIMILPTITTITIDAVRALPNGLREASLALGATRWQTIRKTLIPAASSGIFTGIILGTGRAIGETLAISFVIGSNPNNFPFRIVDYFPFVNINPSSTITVQLLFSFKEAINGSLTYDSIWTLAFILLVISLLLVIASRWVGSRSSYNVRQKRSNRTVARSEPAIAVSTQPQTSTGGE